MVVSYRKKMSQRVDEDSVDDRVDQRVDENESMREGEKRRGRTTIYSERGFVLLGQASNE